MGKLLLTSGQVQVLLSSTIIAAITFSLFLAGYTIQQHSIHTLQKTLKPRLPSTPPPNTPPTPLSASLRASRLFGGTPNSKSHIAFQQYITPQENAQPVEWSKLAHVQMVTDHHSVCSAIMVLAELHRLKSPARRILLFPRAWAMEGKARKGEASDPYIDSTRRLLRRAARRYRVELRPIVPLVEGADEGASESYSLASLWSLADVERAMVLAGPGLLNDATALDAILAYAPSAPLTLLQDNATTGLKATDLLLASPSLDTYSTLRSSSSLHKDTALETLASLLDPLTLSPSANDLLISSIGTLHNTSLTFNATAFQENPYILFSDPKLPGPEWEMPYEEVVKARPEGKEQDWVWTKLYGNFALKRFEICGLGLEVWRE